MVKRRFKKAVVEMVFAEEEEITSDDVRTWLRVVGSHAPLCQFRIVEFGKLGADAQMEMELGDNAIKTAKILSDAIFKETLGGDDAQA